MKSSKMNEVLIQTLHADDEDIDDPMTETQEDCTENPTETENDEYEEVSLDRLLNVNSYRNPSDFKWDRQKILLLLREYRSRITEFRNPMHKKIDVWEEVSMTFNSYGFNICGMLLNKKFRNMKNTFVNLFFNNLDKKKPVKWEYYYIFLELFKDDKTYKESNDAAFKPLDALTLDAVSDEDLGISRTGIVHSTTTKHKKVNTKSSKSSGFSWTRELNVLLLNEYKNRLAEFRNPKIQKRALWTEIAGTFRDNGHNVTEEMLDKKFRSMKQMFISNVRSGKPTSWKYQKTFLEIFQDTEIPDIAVPVVAMCNYDDSAADELTACKEISLDIQRKRLQLDQERVNELKKLRFAFEDSNRIQKDRNALLEQLVNVFRRQ